MDVKKGVRFWPMMVTVFLGSFVVMLSSSTINIALPYLMTSLNANLDTAKWAITGFMLTMGTSAPLAAFLGEKLSYKRLYLLSIAGFATVSLLVAFSSDIYMLIIIRFLQGLFGGVTVPATMAIIYQVIPKEKQVAAISVWSIAPTLAPALGPTISGFLIQYFSWKAIFFINIPLGIIAIVMGLKFMPYYKLSNVNPFDKLGITLSVVSSASLLFAFSEGSVYGWGSAGIVALLIIGALLMTVFVLWELHTENPVLNLRAFKYTKFFFGVIISCIINIALYSGSFLTPIFLQNIQGMAPLDSALVLLPASICMAVLMPIVGMVYRKIGPLPLLILGILFMSFGTWRMALLTIDTAHSYIRLWMAFRYIGLALATLPASYAGMSILPKALSGYGSSIINWMKQMFACLSIGIFSSILSSRTAYHASALSSTATTTAAVGLAKASGCVMGIDDIYFISCIIILVALPFSVFLKAGKQKSIQVTD